MPHRLRLFAIWTVAGLTAHASETADAARDGTSQPTLIELGVSAGGGASFNVCTGTRLIPCVIGAGGFSYATQAIPHGGSHLKFLRAAGV